MQDREQEAGPDELAQRLEREGDELEQRAHQVGEEIQATREDWQHKQNDPQVPGAVGGSEEATAGDAPPPGDPETGERGTPPSESER